MGHRSDNRERRGEALLSHPVAPQAGSHHRAEEERQIASEPECRVEDSRDDRVVAADAWHHRREQRKGDPRSDAGDERDGHRDVEVAPREEGQREQRDDQGEAKRIARRGEHALPGEADLPDEAGGFAGVSRRERGGRHIGRGGFDGHGKRSYRLTGKEEAGAWPGGHATDRRADAVTDGPRSLSGLALGRELAARTMFPARGRPKGQ